MNKNVKEEIIRLRTEGYRYQEIADVFGLSINTVKSYCLRSNVQPDGKPEKPITEYRFCRCCGKRIESKDKRRRNFCSQKCNRKWWSEHRDQVNRKSQVTVICKNCHKPFQAYEADERIFCCRACYNQYHSEHVVRRVGWKDYCAAEQN